MTRLTGTGAGAPEESDRIDQDQKNEFVKNHGDPSFSPAAATLEVQDSLSREGRYSNYFGLVVQPTAACHVTHEAGISVLVAR